MFDVEAWRRQFPIFARLVYINSCSYGALAASVKAAMACYLDDRDAQGADWDKWVAMNEALRAAYARLLNADAREIAVTASASAGINAVASALDFSGPRSKVVVSDFEFPTAAQIWHAQERRGARVVHAAPAADGTAIPLSAFERLIDGETALVCVSHVCYRNGARIDVEEVAKLAHERGALVMVDSFQALGTFPIDVKALGVDFLIGGALKYLLGTAGVALLYVRGKLIERLVPTASGWFAQADIAAMDITANRPSPTASRFEAGTPPVPSLYGALAGLAIIEKIGPLAIRNHVLALHDELIAGLDDLGAHLATPREAAARGAMLAVKSSDAKALVAALAGEGIITSHRDGNVRFSPHLYNNADDIAAVIAALHKRRGLLA
ncbi:MAG: aminotransferase class V-fold PLP-dependent enzyme [Pseudomonadota bacterium]